MKECPFCGKPYEEELVVCPNCVSEEMFTNWAGELDQVELEYKQAFDSADYVMKGLQKDAIQNSWGARLEKKNIKDWSFTIELIEDKGKKFLVLTDQGCWGLTGPDYKDFPRSTLLQELKNNDYRLAKFRTMRYSGDNELGGGKFGRGKMLYLVASKTRHILWDSFVKGENAYKAGSMQLVQDRLNVSPVITGEKAKRYLIDNISKKIEPLSKYGTRIVIIDPRDELIETMENSSMVNSIGDIWWPVIQRGLEISVIYKGKKRNAKVPDEFKDLEKTDTKERKMRIYDPVKFEFSKTKCRFKQCRLFLSLGKKVPEEIRGIYLYRRDMKIAKIKLLDIPPEIEEKFYGYVEVEPQSDLERFYIDEDVEGLQHASFTTGYRVVLGAIKRAVEENFRAFKKEFKIEDRGVYDQRENNEAMERSMVKFQKLWPEMQGIGQGPIKKGEKLEIESESLRFPRPENYINVGEELRDVSFKITNGYPADLSVNIAIQTLDEQGNLIEELIKEKVDIPASKSYKTKAFSFNLTTPKYALAGFYLVCSCKTVTVDGKVEEKHSRFIPVGLPPAVPQVFCPVSMQIESMEFPVSGKPRVDFKGKITKIKYKVINNTSLDLSVHFSLRIFDEDKQKELDIEKRDIILKPNGVETISCSDIEIKEEHYKSLLEGGEKGSVLLRAQVNNLNDFSVNAGELLLPPIGANFDNTKKIITIPRAYRLARCDTKVWINRDPGKNIFDMHGWQGTEYGPKSALEESMLKLNLDHPEFLYIEQTKDRDRKDNYIQEQIGRQVLILLVSKNTLDKWPDHPVKKDYKKTIQDDDAAREDLLKSYLATLDYMLGKYYK